MNMEPNLTKPGPELETSGLMGLQTEMKCEYNKICKVLPWGPSGQSYTGSAADKTQQLHCEAELFELPSVGRLISQTSNTSSNLESWNLRPEYDNLKWGFLSPLYTKWIESSTSKWEFL